jgi:hypothetical protein
MDQRQGLAHRLVDLVHGLAQGRVSRPLLAGIELQFCRRRFAMAVAMVVMVFVAGGVQPGR